MAKREVLLFASYCGDDNPRCTTGSPCADCLAMSNVYSVEMDGAEYVRQLAPSRPESDEWQIKLSRILAPLRSGRRPLSPSRLAMLTKLADRRQ